MVAMTKIQRRLLHKWASHSPRRHADVKRPLTAAAAINDLLLILLILFQLVFLGQIIISPMSHCDNVDDNNNQTFKCVPHTRVQSGSTVCAIQI